MPTYVVTGGAGFIGSNFVRLALERDADLKIVTIDLLTYAGNLENLVGVPEERHTFVRADITDSDAMADAVPEGADALINFAAETHVDRSILSPGAFARTNVVGTQVLLDAARDKGVKRFLQVSTDEVYGSLGPDDPAFTEAHPLAPSSPYAGSKAGADLLVLAAHHTYGQDALLTRCANNYGPYQFPEKLIPLMLSNALEDRPLPVYGDGRQVRDWIHTDDHSRAILAALAGGRPGTVYNVGARNERFNIDVVKAILRELDKPESLIQFVEDRPGHDRRYAIDPTRIETELGWRPEVPFEEGLVRTIRWYRKHQDWWRRVKDGSYREFYDTWYGRRHLP
ncbi:MAG TPA: dTDP-glucose 4,6-dehydratase [Phycisphaerae bacterium]|nr:dTDP-glucose 4,6-dehydratase [Phycisphaerae bacterium]